MDYKQTIIDSLDIMRKRDVAEKQTFKARAYQKVITQLKQHSDPITSFEDVKNVEGIGEKIREKIKEIIETGQLQSAERIKQSYNITALDAFQNIYGVGATKANELVSQGYNTIEDLRKAIKKNPKLLHDKQKIGLKYYEDLLERIPRIEMQEHEDILNQLIPDESDFKIDIVGSYRREAETSGDIDVLIRIPHNTSIEHAAHYFNQYIKLLEGFGYITDILALGDKKCMAICKVYNGKHRRLDLLLTPHSEYAYSLLYFTGSDQFNVGFRQYALDKGYSLNEHTFTIIKHNITPVPYMQEEKDIFRFLKLQYVEPKNRINAQQIIPLKKRPRVIQNM